MATPSSICSPCSAPRGGIKPHQRFSIQAKRSEVLFVDYIAEHLTPNGRAAIIVPEGIIFQSQGTDKELRKLLVTNSLVAVISLPAGCFNPYSGVKTSILILDKAPACQSDSIGFFKVDLGLDAIPFDDLIAKWAESYGGRKYTAEQAANEFAGRLIVPETRLSDLFDEFAGPAERLVPSFMESGELVPPHQSL